MLDLWSGNMVNNILGSDISIFCNFDEMKLDALRNIFIIEDGGVISTSKTEREFSGSKKAVNPGANCSCSINTKSLGFRSN